MSGFAGLFQDIENLFPSRAARDGSGNLDMCIADGNADPGGEPASGQNLHHCGRNFRIGDAVSIRRSRFRIILRLLTSSRASKGSLRLRPWFNRFDLRQVFEEFERVFVSIRPSENLLALRRTIKGVPANEQDHC